MEQDSKQTQIFVKDFLTFNLNLRDPKSLRPTLIYLIVRIGKTQYKIPTFTKVIPSQWDRKKQEPMLSPYLSKMDYNNNSVALNIISRLKFLCSEIQQYVCNQMITDSVEIKKLINNKLKIKNKNIVRKENIILSMMQLIDNQQIKESSKRQYRYNVEGFDKFLKDKSKELVSWEDITLSLLNEYRSWLSNSVSLHPITKEEVRMEDNTVNDKITKIYTILTYADRAEKIDIQAKRLDKIKKTNTNRDRVEENKVYITDSELNTLWNLQLSEKEEKVRDIFVFQSLTGQRFSDINGLVISDIERDTVEVIQKKTKHKVSLPLNDKRVKEIVRKYHGNLPKISELEVNKTLKQIARKANLNRQIECVEMRGGEQYRYKVEMWQLVSTHTARRSFISNGLKNGYDSHTLRGITGHHTDDAFSRYNRMSSKDAVNVYISQQNNNPQSNQPTVTTPTHSHISIEDYNRQMAELYNLKNQVEILLNRSKRLAEIQDVISDSEYYDRLGDMALYHDTENISRDFAEEGK